MKFPWEDQVQGGKGGPDAAEAQILPLFLSGFDSPDHPVTFAAHHIDFSWRSMWSILYSELKQSG